MPLNERLTRPASPLSSSHLERSRAAHAQRQRAAIKTARAFGWFSIGLGLAKLFFPRQVARMSGLRGSDALLQAWGVREVATGLHLLTSDAPAAGMWARVGGDALDMATLAGAGRDPLRAGTALAAVAGMTAMDIACARRLQERPPARPAHDYRQRSGFRRPLGEMRGIARQDDAGQRIPSAQPPRHGTQAGWGTQVVSAAPGTAWGEMPG